MAARRQEGKDMAGSAATLLTGLCLTLLPLEMAQAGHHETMPPSADTKSAETGTAEMLDAAYRSAVKAYKKRDYANAFTLFGQLAEANQYDAQYNYGAMLKAGLGTPQNFSEALFWVWQAQLGKVEKAQDYADDIIGMMPEKRVQQVRDRVNARLNDRVHGGDREAIMQLAEFYQTLTPEADHGRAYLWYSVAAAMKLEGSYPLRDDAADNLDPKTLIGLQDEAGDKFKELTAMSADRGEAELPPPAENSAILPPGKAVPDDKGEPL
jgi:hypothetical protein